MNLLKKSELKSHDVYEFCYAKDYPNHWSEDSLFLRLCFKRMLIFN